MTYPTFVKQEQKCGCVPACLAMIVGKKYWEVAVKFRNKFDKQGIKIGEDIINYIICEGFMAERRKLYGYTDVKTNNKRMLKPFANIHLVHVRQFADSEDHHAVIMTKSGKIICPSGEKLTWNDFYEIVEIIGCFKQ